MGGRRRGSKQPLTSKLEVETMRAALGVDEIQARFDRELARSNRLWIDRLVLAEENKRLTKELAAVTAACDGERLAAKWAADQVKRKAIDAAEREEKSAKKLAKEAAMAAAEEEAASTAVDAERAEETWKWFSAENARLGDENKWLTVEIRRFLREKAP